MKIKTDQRGTIALISVLVISTIILVMALGISDANISSSYMNANSSSDKMTYYLAESCIEETLLRLERDTSFASETIDFGNGSCVVNVSGSSIKNINIAVVYGNFTQNYQAETQITTKDNSNNATLISWNEI